MYIFLSLEDLNAVFPSVCESILSRMNWARGHGLFPLPDLIISALISKMKLLNLLVKRFMLSQVFFLADCILHFSCPPSSIFRMKASVPHTYSSV